MDIELKRVEVEIECMEGTVWGEGGERLHIQGYEPRQWRHLDTMQFETVLKARVPRVKYPDGHTEMVRVPWAQPHGRFTVLFESWAIEVLLASQSVNSACELLDLDWGSAQRIMNRAVERGLARRSLEGIEKVGMDEKSFRRGHDSIGILNDLDGSRVVEVTAGNDTESGRRLWQALDKEQRGKVKAAAMDMSAGFAAATRIEAPQAVIVYDKFHVSALLSKAVDLVHRQEHRVLSKDGDERLKGTKQLWLYNPIHMSEKRREQFEEVLQGNLKTSRACLVKENFCGFWDQGGRWQGAGYFKKWYNHAIRTRLEPIKKVARTLKKHLDGLLNYFAYPITNAASEAVNSRIQALKANARGFRSFENYRTRILFFLGNLNMAQTA
jgi:transposase